ncbi:MAG: MFS transporter [Hyphomonadaceae bacterium]|nr:MFS transporter [Hyphomonadaceae bacterium]
MRARVQTSPVYPYIVVVMLGLIYTFNFLDRQILSVLAEPIRKDLNLSDTQLGMLTGLAFAVFYTTFGIPLAWMADRVRRVWIIAACCTVWSLFSAACGLANNFLQLALARMGVGVGEAGGNPSSYSLISDYFPSERRGMALGLYQLGLPLGSTAGLAAGGWIAAEHGWRVAFFSVAAPGVLLALLLVLVVREPQRGALDRPANGQAHEPTPPLMRGIAAFLGDPVLRSTTVATCCAAFILYAFISWAPAFLMRVRGMSLTDIALYYSLTSGAGAVVGTLGGGLLVDRLRRWSMRAYALTPGVAFLAALPLFLGFLWAPTWQSAMIFLGLLSSLLNIYQAPILTIVQNTAPPARRAVSAAMMLFIVNLVGLGCGPLLVGMISDHVSAEYGERSLLFGLLGLAPVFLFAAVSFYFASRAIGRRGKLQQDAISDSMTAPVPLT